MDVLPPLDSLKCARCSDYLRDPLTLQCQHSFCKACLLSFNGATTNDLADFYAPEDEAEEPLLDADGAPALDEDGRPLKKVPRTPKRMHCPTCIDDLGLELPENPSEPYDNERLARLVELVTHTPVLCQNCKSSQSEVKCTTCLAYCCKPCWEQTHAAPIFSSHEAEPLTHGEVSAVPKCPQHVLNDLEFFVTEQEAGACQVCLLKGDFVGAAYSLVNDVRRERQEDVEVGLDELLSKEERLMTCRTETLSVLAELETNLEARQIDVKENFALIRSALDARETETLQALSALKEAKTRVLQSQVEKMDRTKSEIDDGVRGVRLVLDHSNPLEVIYSYYVLQERVASLNDVRPTAPKKCAACEGETDEQGIDVVCHHPAVDAELLVVLSDRVKDVVGAYAAVPDALVVEEVAMGARQADSLNPTMSTEQRRLLEEVSNSAGNEEEYGCVIA